MPEVRVVAHDVPQHRTAADRHHRLGQRLVVGAHAHAEPTAEQHDLHDGPPSFWTASIVAERRRYSDRLNGSSPHMAIRRSRAAESDHEAPPHSRM